MTDDRRHVGDLVVKLTGELAQACADRDRLAGLIERAGDRLKLADWAKLAYEIGRAGRVDDLAHRMIDALARLAEAGAILAEAGPPTYVCPQCGAVSHNPNDVANRYCGACHVFEGDEPS